MSELLTSIIPNEDMILMPEETSANRAPELVAIAEASVDRAISKGRVLKENRQIEIDSYFPLTKKGREELHESFRRARGMSPKA